MHIYSESRMKFIYMYIYIGLLYIYVPVCMRRPEQIDMISSRMKECMRAPHMQSSISEAFLVL